MRSMSLLNIGAVCVICILLSAWALLTEVRRKEKMARRVALSRGVPPVAPDKQKGAMRQAWSRLVGLLGQAMLRTGLLSSRTRNELELTLMSAGLRGNRRLEIFIGSKIVLTVGLPVTAAIAEQATDLPPMLGIVIMAVAAGIGLLAPDMVVRSRRKSYVKRVESGLADALDLLVICAQAGLGLNAAILRVAEEMQRGQQPIGTELALTANEMQFMDTRAALLNLGSRTGIKGLARLGTTLVQSIQFGTPLTEAMRALSSEMRAEVLNRFEARAARLGVVLTVPMIVFILPCVFLVIGGPAAVQVMQIGK
jgi:tight adherence protein C